MRPSARTGHGVELSDLHKRKSVDFSNHAYVSVRPSNHAYGGPDFDLFCEFSASRGLQNVLRCTTILWLLAMSVHRAHTNCFGGECDLVQRGESGVCALSAGRGVGFVKTKSCLWKYIQPVCVFFVHIFLNQRRSGTILHRRQLYHFGSQNLIRPSAHQGRTGPDWTRSNRLNRRDGFATQMDPFLIWKRSMDI